MGQPFPDPIDLDGDDPVQSPYKNQKSLLGSLRGANKSRRLETDADNNLYVHVADDDTAGSMVVSPIAVGSVTSVPSSTLTTIVTYTAAATTRLSRISVSGTVYAKYQLFFNTVLVETKRSGPERSIDFAFKSPLGMVATDILDVKVTHYNTALLENFEATVYGA